MNATTRTNGEVAAARTYLSNPTREADAVAGETARRVGEAMEDVGYDAGFLTGHAEGMKLIAMSVYNLFEPQMLRSPAFRECLDAFGLWPNFRHLMATCRQATGIPRPACDCDPCLPAVQNGVRDNGWLVCSRCDGRIGGNPLAKATGTPKALETPRAATGAASLTTHASEAPAAPGTFTVEQARRITESVMAEDACPECESAMGEWEPEHTADGKPIRVRSIRFCTHCTLKQTRGPLGEDDARDAKQEHWVGNEQRSRPMTPAELGRHIDVPG